MKNPPWVDTAFSHIEVPLRIEDARRSRGAAPGDIVCGLIDILRATSTIVAALGNGCLAVHPRPSPGAALDTATALRQEHGEANVLLGGEQDAKPIPGFDGGNSPLEYTRDRIGGRRLVLSTSNGTKTLAAAGECGRGFIAAFANLEAVAQRIAEEAERQESPAILIACSGREGGYCEEDAAAAGLIVAKVRRHLGKIELSDSSRAAVHTAEYAVRDVAEMLRNCTWGKHLASLGLGPDIEFCAKRDWTKVVPEMKGGVIG